MANPDVIAWHGSLDIAFFSCRTELGIAHMFRRLKGSSEEGKILEPTRNCVSKSLTEGKTLTRSILSQRLSPKADLLVKDYYSTWTAGMKEISSLASESDADARAGIIQIQSSLNKAWALIELELDI